MSEQPIDAPVLPPVEPLVSVLTPVFNGEAYLRECIESVLRQSYRNWEYVIVDNCSRDGTLAIAREYAAQDSRIRIHSNASHVRVIENHNIAFRQMAPQSAYCKVIAADDWLFPECIERMVGLADAHPSVAIVGAYGLYSDARLGVAWVGLPYSSQIVPGGREACRLRLIDGAYVFGEDRGAFTVDVATTPPSMDVRGHKGPNAGKLLPAIFELDGTTLRICYDLAGKGRPVKLETEPGSRRFLVTYEKR